MNSLTFTVTREYDGALRRWDLRGNAGRVRFELADAITFGLRRASIYLHGAAAPGGAELEPCDVCGRCWRDSMGRDLATDLRARWADAGYDDTVIREALERWYRENLVVWAADAASGSEYIADPDERIATVLAIAPAYVRPVNAEPVSGDLGALFAMLVPDLPIPLAALLGLRLAEGGYQVIKAGEAQ